MTRMLIVEDDESVRGFTARAFEIAGYKVDTAGDGLDGLDMIVAARGRYDIVLSDIRMPEMDGIAMAKAAAEAFPGLRIVLMTGYAEQRERAAELDGIVSDVVSKPFTLKEIRERIARSLETRGDEAA